MWKKSYSKFYNNVDIETVWNIATDIDNWPSWHDDLESCKLIGEFKVGNHFFLKPKKMRTFKILLTEIKEMESFTDCTHFPFAKMHDTHTFEKKDDGVILSHQVRVSGPLKWLWVFLVAKNVAKDSEKEMDALIKETLIN